MKIRDQKAWDACRSTYSRKVITVAEALANGTETRMASGVDLEMAAERTMSGLFWDSAIDWDMMHTATEILAKTWKHGKAFQHWEKKQEKKHCK